MRDVRERVYQQERNYHEGGLKIWGWGQLLNEESLTGYKREGVRSKGGVTVQVRQEQGNTCTASVLSLLGSVHLLLNPGSSL